MYLYVFIVFKHLVYFFHSHLLRYPYLISIKASKTDIIATETNNKIDSFEVAISAALFIFNNTN